MKNELSQIISQSRSLVFFGGAGVSTESGIPDFRSVDGLYNQKYDYPPEQMLSHTFSSTRRRISTDSIAINTFICRLGKAERRAQKARRA